MERLHRRRGSQSKSRARSVTTTIVDPSDSHFKGKPSSDSGSCRSWVTVVDDQVGFGGERSCSGLQIGTPMKKLLADELARETESKKRSPSIIARLMGLDGLPAQQSASKQHKRVSDNYQQGGGSGGVRKNGKLSDGRSHRKNGKGQQRFKDVYEVAGSPSVETRSHTSHATSHQNVSEDEIAYIRQKFTDVKRFSTDERFQNSKEFHDALEVLDSNKDLLLRFLQEPNTLFSKHLRDLHGVPESHCGHVFGKKSTSTLKSNIDVIGSQAGRETSRKIDISRSQRHLDSCHNGLCDRRHIESEDSEDARSMPTRIVVLKPNFMKLPSSDRSVSSPSPSRDTLADIELHDEYQNMVHSGSEKRGKRSTTKNYDSYERNYQESRNITRELTRRMKNKIGEDSFSVYSAGYKGYSADESSHEMSENDSSYDSEMVDLSACSSQVRGNRSRALTSCYAESSVNKEAKRRLSERWNMTHRSQEIGSCRKGNTLAEMLAIPDLDVRLPNLGAVVAHGECYRSGRDAGCAESGTTVGISSRDGWKDACVGTFSRSRSLPASSTHIGSPKSNTKREALVTERLLARKESISHGRSKTIKRGKSMKGSISQTGRPYDKKPLAFFPVNMEITDDMVDEHSRGNMIIGNFDGKESPEVKAVILEMTSGEHDSSSLLNAAADEKQNFVHECYSSCDQPISTTEKQSDAMKHDDSSSCFLPSVEQKTPKSCDHDASTSLQCAGLQPESPASSKDSEQPSPVSVLDAPFVEEVSSGSECFERVSAELHGLRKQLQLLKLESDGYDEGSMLISSDEDEEESVESYDNKGGFVQAEASWELSYLVDVLNESELDHTDPDSFVATWYSPDCPIDPGVFEMLEKKYNELKVGLKSERKLLFDCINSGIIEISQQYIDLHPRVKPLKARVSPQWLKDMFRTELHKLLEEFQKKATESEMDAVILGNMRWLELGDHVDTIGRDIERLLTDELVAEVLSF